MAMVKQRSLLMVLLAVFSTASSQTEVSLSYSAVKSLNSSKMCALSQPSIVIPMKAGPKFRCAAKCTSCKGCVVHQMNDDLEQCQLFNYSPINFTGNVDHCKAYGITDSYGTPTDINSCSFPFTSDGQLYYSCATNQFNQFNQFNQPCDAWCRNVNAKKIDCAKNAFGQNLTVNILIPTFTSRTPLKSIYNWLTILSRLDSNFPLWQTYTTYQNGFGDIGSNFWLGLTRVYYLTNSQVNGGLNYRLRFELLSASTSQWYSAEYSQFSLDGQAAGFALKVSSSATGDAGDALNSYPQSNGYPFLTTGSCHGYYGAWWYLHPGYCNFVAMFGPTVSRGGHSGFYWNNIGYLKASRMMIRMN